MPMPPDITKDEEHALQLMHIALDLLGVPESERAPLEGQWLYIGREKRGVA